MKIPFNIKYRPEIESGKYKVVSEFGEPTRIICWDSKYHSNLPVIALIDDGDGEDMVHVSSDGKSEIDQRKGFTRLVIVTDEPEELTEFEKEVKKIFLAIPHQTSQLDSYVKEKSCELLTLAKETLEKEGWVGDMRELWYSKGHLEGYAKGQEDAEKRLREHEPTMYHYPFFSFPDLPCYWGRPCTNPQHDCINCPQQGESGTCKTNTKID